MAHIALSVLQIREDGISLKSFDAMEPCIISLQMSDYEVGNCVRGSLPENIVAGILFSVLNGMLILQRQIKSNKPPLMLKLYRQIKSDELPII